MAIDRIENGNFWHYKPKTRKQALRAFCYECMGADRQEENPTLHHDDIRNCTDPMCPLFDFRTGKNPYAAKREVSQAGLDALRKYRESKKVDAA